MNVGTAEAFLSSCDTSSSSRCPSSAAASETTASAARQDLKDEDRLSQLACVDTFMSIAADVTPVHESPTPSSPEYPVAKMEYSPNFNLLYGVYRSLRGQLRYTSRIPAPGQRCVCVDLPPVIESIHTSAARWFLLLAFALRQCTSNYTVWKDRRDVLMSPVVLEKATREALREISVPEVVLADTVPDKMRQETMLELKERRKKVYLVSQHWLPALPDISWKGRISPWRAVHWELMAVGCFTRLYHKNFQLWHHRKELLMYALQQSPSRDECDGVDSLKGPLLGSEAIFNEYLRRHHGLSFADVDERPTLHAVLCNEDGKNYHAWLHLSWYLNVFSFLVTPPSHEALKEHAEVIAAATAGRELSFTVHPEWIVASESSEQPPAAALRPYLPPSPLTSELQFTAELIYQDCRNNSAWCHRLAVLRERLLRRLWRQLCSGDFIGSDGTPSADQEWQRTVRIICFEELNYSLQWLYVDPTNEVAYTHARTVALLFHTLTTRQHVWAAERSLAGGSEELQRYLADAPLVTPVALTNSQLCSDADTGTVSTSTHILHLLDTRQRHIMWGVYVESFSLLRHMQRVLDTVIRPRVKELEVQATHILRSTTAINVTRSLGQAPRQEAIEALNSLYERGSQHMLDNLHQIDAALYFACHAKLEEMWLTYMDSKQRRRVQQLRPSEAYSEGIRPEWLVQYPWCEGERSLTGMGEKDYRQDAVVRCFLAYEAVALSKAKRLTIADSIRFKYWKNEVLNVMFRSYDTRA